MTWRWECIEAAGPRRGEDEPAPEETPALPEDDDEATEPAPEPAESEDE